MPRIIRDLLHLLVVQCYLADKTTLMLAYSTVTLLTGLELFSTSESLCRDSSYTVLQSVPLILGPEIASLKCEQCLDFHVQLPTQLSPHHSCDIHIHTLQYTTE